MIENNINDNRTKNELLKESCPSLAGSISKALADDTAQNFTHEDYEFLKFHGVYQQDDRDLRQQGKKFIMMVRVKIPGGVVNSEQYLTLDRLSELYANNTLRITSRQSIQFHGVLKKNLARTIKEINETLLTTLAACGDVARNVMASSKPDNSPVLEQVFKDALKLNKSLLPATPVYHDIWIDGKQIELDETNYSNFVDPIYGKGYLPRKFKTAFAIPPLNDIDIFTNCLGFIAITENDKLLGYNLLAGGGMGKTHNNNQTYPRLADVIGFFPPEYIEEVTRAVLIIFRDYGDRTNRKHARLKYLLAEKGIEWFKNEIEKLTAFQFEPPKPFKFTHQQDSFGWHKQDENKLFVGIHVETGRIKDSGIKQYKSAFKKIAAEFSPQFRFTASNNLYLANIAEKDKNQITRILKQHGIDVENQGTPLRLSSMACVALPTCGLALAESERYLPDVVTQIEQILEELGIPDEEITIRMTGCPNGCARPYTAEIAFVGKAPGRYQIYLGGDKVNTRLNRLYKDNVRDSEIAGDIRSLLKAFVEGRKEGEGFGDWCVRSIFKEEPTETIK